MLDRLQNDIFWWFTGWLKNIKQLCKQKLVAIKQNLGLSFLFPASLCLSYTYIYPLRVCQVLKLVFIDKRIELARVSHGSSRSFTFEASNSSVIDNSVAGNFIFRTPTSQSNCIESLGYQRRFFKRKITLIN